MTKTARGGDDDDDLCADDDRRFVEIAGALDLIGNLVVSFRARILVVID